MAFDPNAAAPPGSGVFGLPFTVDDARVVLVPVPFDATTSYGKGTSNGPAAILEASKQVDLFDLETGRPYQAGITMLDEPANVRAWNDEAGKLADEIIARGGDVSGHPELEKALAKVNAISREVDEHVYQETRRLLERGKIVGVVGGDHSTPFGAMRAHLEKYPALGILHFDAHADLREAYEGFDRSHASIMFNVTKHLAPAKLVQVGIRDFCEEEHQRIASSNGRIVTHFDATMKRALRDGERFSSIAKGIVDSLPEHVYVSFDIDGLDPALCPHTGTPVPGGLALHEAIAIVETVARSGRTIVGFDLNEVAPGPEGDEWDANVGARVLYKLIGWTLVSQRPA